MQKILRAISSSSSLFFQVVAAHQLRSFCFLMHATNRGFSQKKHKMIYRNASSLFEGIFNLSPPFFTYAANQRKALHHLDIIIALVFVLRAVGSSNTAKETVQFFICFFPFFGGRRVLVHFCVRGNRGAGKMARYVY